MRVPNDRPLRVLPLGDSITQGSPDLPGGYRAGLERRLLAAGWDFEFVGRRLTNSEGMCYPGHEGHPGFRIEELRRGHANAYSSCPKIEETLASTRPDWVLLLAGANNLYFDAPCHAAEAMGRLWDGILGAESQPLLFVGTLPMILPGLKSWGMNIPGDVGARVAAFNGLLGDMTESRIRSEQDVCLVDVAAPINGPDDLQADGVHPAAHAMNRMGEIWWRALVEARNRQPSFGRRGS